MKMALLEGDGLGFGMLGRLKRSLERRGKNVQGTVNVVRDTALGKKKLEPGNIVGDHVQGLREANQELAPGLKQL